MNREKLLRTLCDIGLSQNESKIYLAGLSLGLSSAKELSRASGISRSSVYAIIESLQSKQLLHNEYSGLKRKFKMAKPESLGGVIDSKRRLLETALPTLSSIYDGESSTSTIKQYSGLNSVKALYGVVLEEQKYGGSYSIITDQEQWLNLDPEFFMDFIQKRSRLGLNIRLLSVDSATARKHKKYQSNYAEELRVLKPGTELKINLIITERKVIIHKLTVPVMAVVVENPSIVSSFRELFEVIWVATAA